MLTLFLLLLLIGFSNYQINGNFYTKGLINVISNVASEVYLNNIEFSQYEFENLIKSWWKVNLVALKNCNFIAKSDFDFEDYDYQINYLSLAGWGNSKNGNWGSKAGRFERLIRSMSKCDLNDSLSTLNLERCDLDYRYAMNILRKYHMNDVEIEFENIKPY